MKLETISNKTLMRVVKQLESLRNTYRNSHQYEIPVGNPIEKDIEKILKVLNSLSTGTFEQWKRINSGALAKLSELDIKETYENDSITYKFIPIGKSEKGSLVNKWGGFWW